MLVRCRGPAREVPLTTYGFPFVQVVAVSGRGSAGQVLIEEGEVCKIEAGATLDVKPWVDLYFLLYTPIGVSDVPSIG